ncbi:SufS family cysteine desulfurase [Patescibacteria group bacterium]|nr:SufS family cysteine desulfurase [Patescibacteria group bacterium]
MELNNKTIKRIKKDFPIFKNNKRLVYLDNAATSQKPKQVINTLKNFYEKDYANIHRGIYRLSEKATELYMKSKEIVAEFIGSDPEEIIYTKNTTESLNLLSYSLPFIISESKGEIKSKSKRKSKKNEIVLTELEHHSNLIPWQQLAKRNNMKIKFIEIKPENYELDFDDALKKITNKTAIVAINHVSNSFGLINPIKEIIKFAKSKKAITIVDAAQSMPHMKVNVKDLNCDFLAFSGHKMLGPTGIGVLYGKKELLKKLPPFLFGGGMINDVELKKSSWAEIPFKFEAGTPDISSAIGLGRAIRYIQSIGIENIESWEKKLTAYALNKLKEIPGIKVYNSSKNISGILSFNFEKIPPHDVASLLDFYGIAIRAGYHCNIPLMKKLNIPGTCRISFYFYNSFEDIDYLVKILKKISLEITKKLE